MVVVEFGSSGGAWVRGKGEGGGGWISRALRRWVDQREEPRAEGKQQTAVLTHRGREHVVPVSNISSSGAMVAYSEMPKVGDAVTLRLLDHGAVAGQVRWVRGGQVGINFAAPLE